MRILHQKLYCRVLQAMSLIMASRIRAREVLARFSRLRARRRRGRSTPAFDDPPLGQNVEALAGIRALDDGEGPRADVTEEHGDRW